AVSGRHVNVDIAQDGSAIEAYIECINDKDVVHVHPFALWRAERFFRMRSIYDVFNVAVSMGFSVATSAPVSAAIVSATAFVARVSVKTVTIEWRRISLVIFSSWVGVGSLLGSRPATDACCKPYLSVR